MSNETIIPTPVANAMRYDAAPLDALLPLEIVACGTGIAKGTISNWPRTRADAPKFHKPAGSTKCYLRKRDVIDWIDGSKDE